MTPDLETKGDALDDLRDFRAEMDQEPMAPVVPKAPEPAFDADDVWAW